MVKDWCQLATFTAILPWPRLSYQTMCEKSEKKCKKISPIWANCGTAPYRHVLWHAWFTRGFSLMVVITGYRLWMIDWNGGCQISHFVNRFRYSTATEDGCRRGGWFPLPHCRPHWWTEERRCPGIHCHELETSDPEILFFSWGWTPSRNFLLSHSLSALKEPDRSSSLFWRTRFTTRTKCYWRSRSSSAPSHHLSAGKSMSTVFFLLLSLLPLSRRRSWGTRLALSLPFPAQDVTFFKPTMLQFQPEIFSSCFFDLWNLTFRH